MARIPTPFIIHNRSEWMRLIQQLQSKKDAEKKDKDESVPINNNED